MTTQRAHPTPRTYWLIAAVLAVITAAEVTVPQISAFDGTPRVLLLFALAGVKFAAVVAFFMHLKFDKPLYRNLFLIGLFGAIPIYVVVLLTFSAL
ncbi:MAG: cytochrome C oxidase subunit IV family protein [Acidimicrobiia bacterium]